MRGLYLFSDYLSNDPAAVMGAGETTAVLYHAARPLAPPRRVLDLGCGAGTLALLLARESVHVLATDISPRAIAFARFNAAMNGIGNVDFQTGDLYEPAGLATFDLIVSQPPYYPAEPGENLLFLHAGPRGDELAQRILAGAPQRLNPGGRALVFASWPPDRQLPQVPAVRVLDLHTNRREPNGTRQSITVLDKCTDAPAWSASYEVPPDCWGHVHSWRIAQILSAHQLLRGPESALLAARLRLPEGAVPWQEGSDLFLRCPPASLAGFVPIGEATWQVLSTVHQAGTAAAFAAEPASLAIVRRALERGLLIPA